MLRCEWASPWRATRRARWWPSCVSSPWSSHSHSHSSHNQLPRQVSWLSSVASLGWVTPGAATNTPLFFSGKTWRPFFHPTPFLPVRPRFSTILCKFAHKKVFSFGCHPLKCVTRGGPPLPAPLVTPLIIVRNTCNPCRCYVMTFIYDFSCSASSCQATRCGSRPMPITAYDTNSNKNSAIADMAAQYCTIRIFAVECEVAVFNIFFSQ